MSLRVTIVTILITVLCYQNFQFSAVNPWQIKEIDESTRIDHAKELLGKYYEKSPASYTKGIPFFEVHLLNHIQANLPKKYKSKAGKITNAILEESEKYGFDPIFVAALIKTESRFNPDAVGSVGEIGLMQIRPETGAWIAKRGNLPWKGKSSLQNPVSNIRIGVYYISFLRDYFEGRASKYLSAYNVGPGKLKKMMASDLKPKIYSTNVMKNYKKIYQEIALFQNLHNLASNQVQF